MIFRRPCCDPHQQLFIRFLLCTFVFLAFGLLGHSTSALAACEPTADQASFYTDANFRGSCVIRGVGEFPNAESIGLPNDSISSLRSSDTTIMSS